MTHRNVHVFVMIRVPNTGWSMNLIKSLKRGTHPL